MVDLLESRKTVWANAESKLTVHNVRLHIRILRRLSLAVVDPAVPVYHESALYFFDRNEEIYGRRSKEMVLQESPRYFDSFVASIPEPADLRNAAETLHVMLLRGYNLKLSGRGVTETAIIVENISSISRNRENLPARRHCNRITACREV